MQFWSQSIEKQIGTRVQTVLEDPYLLKAFERFGAEIVRRSSVFHGLAKFLSDEGIHGRRCFEVGTWHGLTAAILSRHFDEVVTVDIIHNHIKHDVLSHLGIRNVRCIDIIDNEEKRRIADELEFDFAYLDGNHTDDTRIDFDMTKKCGRVLMHESWPWQEKVWELAHQLPCDEVTFGGFGLALWRRNEPTAV